MVTERDQQDEPEGDFLADDGDDQYDEGEDASEINEVQVSDVQGFVRNELEALATEIEESQVDLPAEQTTALEEAALQVSQLPEALEVIRDARGRLGKGKGGRGKDRDGRGRSQGTQPPPRPSAGGARSGKSRSATSH